MMQIKFTLKSTLHVQRILKNARKVRIKDGFGSIYISPDLSLDERIIAFKKLVEELELRKSKELDKVHVIKKNKIFSFSRDSGNLARLEFFRISQFTSSIYWFLKGLCNRV